MFKNHNIISRVVKIPYVAANCLSLCMQYNVDLDGQFLTTESPELSASLNHRFASSVQYRLYNKGP